MNIQNKMGTKPAIAFWVGGGWTWKPFYEHATDYWAIEWLLFRVSIIK